MTKTKAQATISLTRHQLNIWSKELRIDLKDWPNHHSNIQVFEIREDFISRREKHSRFHSLILKSGLTISEYKEANL